MPYEDDNFLKVIALVMVGLFVAACLHMHFVHGPELDRQRAVRQQQIDTFYTVHRCKPEGYVATRYEPIRTYRCDNGVYVAADMGK